MHTYTEYANDDEENNLEKVPISVISDLKEHKLSRTKRIHCLGAQRVNHVKLHSVIRC